MIQLYIAASLDGFIATPDGGIDWLLPFESEDYGFDDFLRASDVLVMGRATYDQTVGFETWPYPGKRCIVATTRPLGKAPAGVEGWSGEVAELADELAGEQVWLVGGANLARQFLDHDLVDRIDLFVIPVLLGRGIRLPDRTPQRPLRLERAEAFRNGVAGLHYARAR